METPDHDHSSDSDGVFARQLQSSPALALQRIGAAKL
jgi:hypothetical protein